VKVKLALPKGQLQRTTSDLLDRAGLTVRDYAEGSRSYRPRCEGFPDLFTKVFQEKDIAIQVAIGNYDLGICRRDWVEELLVRYRSDAVVKVADLGYGARGLYAAASTAGDVDSLETLKRCNGSVRIVSEYPNLAESFALKQRLRRFQIFPSWGAVGVYPPENADVAILPETGPDSVRSLGLIPLTTLLEGGACVVANKGSLESKDLGWLLARLTMTVVTNVEEERTPKAAAAASAGRPGAEDGSNVRIAFPDGHQKPHTTEFLKRAQLEFDGYNVGKPTTRPRASLDGVTTKVVRPQDMPLHVANGGFDLAITGRDWLRDHRCRFPSSPVEEVLELGFGKVRIVAVVSQDVPVSSTDDLRRLNRESPLRIASEYTNIADRYANDNHLTPCKIIPTWGASEAFLPEDADVLIENTETGSTIAKHKLKIIDTLFESCACLIGNSETSRRPEKRRKVAQVVKAMQRGLEAHSAS
jgi:ATP phosphoribosyltransferase